MMITREEKLENEIRIARIWSISHAVYCDECPQARCPAGLVIQDALRQLIAMRRIQGFGDLDFEHGAPETGPRYGSDELD